MSAPDLSLVSGAGNRFALLDRFRGGDLEDLAAAARALCAADPTLDGLLALGPGREDGAARLEIHNADGSVALACGNGLRCAALRLFADAARGLAPAPAGARAVIETAAGPRAVELVGGLGDGLAAEVRVGMGRAERFALAHPVEHAGRRLAAHGVRLGNPHCVIPVADERTAPVEALGRALQRHPDFPDGVNAGFLARRAGGLYLRVWERGVGETAACGSGACAAAVAGGALEAGPVEVRMRGGILRVRRADDGALELEGPARDLGPLPGAAAVAAGAGRRPGNGPPGAPYGPGCQRSGRRG